MLKATCCGTQNIGWDLSLAHYRGDEIRLIDTGFEICYVFFVSPHHLNFKALFSSRNRLRALSDSSVLQAGRCHAGHKNANRPYAHGNACTLVAAKQNVTLLSMGALCSTL